MSSADLGTTASTASTGGHAAMKTSMAMAFGSSDEDPMKPSKMELVVQSIFNEGRCLHANQGNMNRIQECTMCFNHVHMMEKKLLRKMKFQKEHGLEGLDEEEYYAKGRKIGSMWGVCSDVYLAPVYSDCTENIDQIFKADMADWPPRTPPPAGLSCRHMLSIKSRAKAPS